MLTWLTMQTRQQQYMLTMYEVHKTVTGIHTKINVRWAPESSMHPQLHAGSLNCYRYVLSSLLGDPSCTVLGLLSSSVEFKFSLYKYKSTGRCICYSHTHQPWHCYAAISTYVGNRWTKAGKSPLSTHSLPWLAKIYVSGLTHFLVKISFMIVVLIQSTVHALPVALCYASIAPSVLEMRLLRVNAIVRKRRAITLHTSVASSIVSHAPASILCARAYPHLSDSIY